MDWLFQIPNQSKLQTPIFWSLMINNQRGQTLSNCWGFEIISLNSIFYILEFDDKQSTRTNIVKLLGIRNNQSKLQTPIFWIKSPTIWRCVCPCLLFIIKLQNIGNWSLDWLFQIPNNWTRHLSAFLLIIKLQNIGVWV